MSPPSLSDLFPLSNALRALSMDAVERAQSGHPGLPMGMADVVTVLYARHLKFFAARPEWPDRDRFILSAGHGSMLLYALNYLTGYAPMTLEEIKNFRQLGALTAGHPEYDLPAGIEMTTGPLGQGLATAAGMAVATAMTRARFGANLTHHKIYVLASDGDLQEGITHEACSLAGHLRLKDLIVLYDDNQISIDGPTSLSFTEDIPARFTAYGWATRRINGHDMAEIDAALTWAREQDCPVLIACRTTIGFGAGEKAGTADVHGSPLGPEGIAAARKNLNWPHAPFDTPADILTAWRTIGTQGRAAFTAWEQALAALPDDQRQAYLDSLQGIAPAPLAKALIPVREKFMVERPVIATRKASQMVLEALVPALPALIGGSADLGGSNLTKVKTSRAVTAQDFSGNYIHYGVREHGMAAMMNGIALHGGFVPYGGTFLCFADYARPAIRLAALMGTPSIFVMTHDSIGLGEDGPTHQPIEHLASLRAMPNVQVMRPAGAIETAACWEMALMNRTGPSILCLSRQNMADAGSYEGARRGGYILQDCALGTPDIVLIATGSEVDVVLSAARTLTEKGRQVRVVSLPCFEIFRAQEAAYQDAVLGPQSAQRIGIEAAVRQGWNEWIGANGHFVGMTGFGASGPYKDLYTHFGITAEKAASIEI